METIQVTRAGGVVTVTLNRPASKNALNEAMLDELRSTLRRIHDNTAEDRVVVITGAGGAFCSGADLSGTPTAEGRDDAPRGLSSPLYWMRRVADACIALHRLPQPTIAKVHGVAVGAGCNLALGCDLVVASQESTFCQIFARRGMSIDFGGSWVLPRLVGLRRAKELAFFGDFLPAGDAESMGLVNRVVLADELDGVVAEWAGRLAAGPPIALAQTKWLLDQSANVSLEQAVEDEGRAQAVNLSTADTAEAITAFFEKRPPVFSGR